jgi:hypothetical protein
MFKDLMRTPKMKEILKQPYPGVTELRRHTGATELRRYIA